MKLVERSLLNPFNWEIQLGPDSLTLIKGKGVLFSPCILKCLFHKKTQIVSYDPFKGDVWAAGMILLECCSTKRGEDFYDYDKFAVRTKDIQVTIYELRKRYSWELINLVEKMLEEEDEERPSAAEIYQRIRKIPNETIR